MDAFPTRTKALNLLVIHHSLGARLWPSLQPLQIIERTGKRKDCESTSNPSSQNYGKPSECLSLLQVTGQTGSTEIPSFFIFAPWSLQVFWYQSVMGNFSSKVHYTASYEGLRGPFNRHHSSSCASFARQEETSNPRTGFLKRWPMSQACQCL